MSTPILKIIFHFIDQKWDIIDYDDEDEIVEKKEVLENVQSSSN